MRQEMKFRVGVNFNNNLSELFLIERFLYLHFRLELFLAQEYWLNWAHKMLVKLTIGVNITNICANILAPKKS